MSYDENILCGLFLATYCQSCCFMASKAAPINHASNKYVLIAPLLAGNFFSAFRSFSSILAPELEGFMFKAFLPVAVTHLANIYDLALALKKTEESIIVYICRSRK